MIGELFGKAWELYKRDVWWLILAGFIIALVFAAAAVVVVVVLLAVVHGIGIDTSTDVTTMSSTTAGSLFGAAFAVYLLGVTLASIVALVFSGGLYEMVVSAEREGRSAEIGQLFGGFRRFGSYALLWLCQVGAIIGVELVVILSFRVLGALGLLVGLIGFCVIVWIVVSWIYGVVLVTDRDMGAVAALKESLLMVKNVGWWRTFGALLVMGIALGAIAFVIGLVTGRAPGLYATLMVIYYIASFPFSICYVAAMYLGSSPAPAAAGFTGAFGVPAPPAPPASAGYAMAGGYQPSAPPVQPAGDDAWKAAADPLAALPPVQSLHAPPAGPAVAGAAAFEPPAPPAPPAPQPPA
jgi:hypothetical protein